MAGYQVAPDRDLTDFTIGNNQIAVDMVTHGPEDAMCCPTKQVVKTFALEGDELAEIADDSTSEEQTLTGQVWQWTTFVDPLSRTNVDDPAQYTVEFKDDGSVSAKADCNQGNGTYTAEKSGMGSSGSNDIEIMAKTRAMCPPESLSDRFIQYLNEAAIYFVQDANLNMDLPADSGTMTFAPAM